MKLSSFVVLSLLACGCAPVAQGPSAQVPGTGRPPRLPHPGNVDSPASSSLRYVCRSQVPTGWIAVDYIESNTSCATGATTTYRYSTAVIVPLSNVGEGMTLEVCAAERIPTDFSHVRMIVAPDRCPAETPSPNPGAATVREIMRVR